MGWPLGAYVGLRQTLLLTARSGSEDEATAADRLERPSEQGGATSFLHRTMWCLVGGNCTMWCLVGCHD